MSIHPNVVEHWIEAEMDGDGDGFAKWIGVLSTDALPQSAGDTLDAGTLDDMIQAMREAHPDVRFGAFRVVPVRADNA